MTARASVRRWLRLWWLALLIQEPSGQAATSRPGSGSNQSSAQAAARTGSAVSANKATAICGLFVAGALAVIRYAKIHGTKHRLWLTALLARRPTKVADASSTGRLCDRSSFGAAARPQDGR